MLSKPRASSPISSLPRVLNRLFELAGRDPVGGALEPSHSPRKPARTQEAQRESDGERRKRRDQQLPSYARDGPAHAAQRSRQKNDFRRSHVQRSRNRLGHFSPPQIAPADGTARDSPGRGSHPSDPVGRDIRCSRPLRIRKHEQLERRSHNLEDDHPCVDGGRAVIGVRLQEVRAWHIRNALRDVARRALELIQPIGHEVLVERRNDHHVRRRKRNEYHSDQGGQEPPAYASPQLHVSRNR